MTCLGPIDVQRRWWRCRCGREAGVYAADELLGVAGRQSRRLQEHLCRLSADVSFAKACEHVKQLLGVQLSAESVRRTSHRHGRRMADWQPRDESSAAAFRQAAGDVEFTVDAGKVHTREQGWKDLKIAVFQKRAPGRPVPATAWQEQRLPAASARLAWADIAPAKQFRRSWRGWSRRLGVQQTGELHVLGDGAAWIWRSVERVFTGSQQTLDIFHACEHLAHAGQRLYGEDTPEAEAFLERGRLLLLDQGWNGICTLVGQELAQENTPQRREPLEKLTNYFAKHTQRLDYAACLKTGQVIGSGTVEGQAKTLGLRLKARGARWRQANVRGMAALVCVRPTDQWHAYWRTAA